MEFTYEFLQYFFWSMYFFAPVMLYLCFVIVVLGLVVGRIEKWEKRDALYWAFITATTVGYGDMRLVKRLSKILSVFIALTGIMFTGIWVAITLHAATSAFEDHVDMDVINQIKERF